MEEVAAQMISGACWNHTTSSADRIGTKPECLTFVPPAGVCMVVLRLSHFRDSDPLGE